MSSKRTKNTWPHEQIRIVVEIEGEPDLVYKLQTRIARLIEIDLQELGVTKKRKGCGCGDQD